MLIAVRILHKVYDRKAKSGPETEFSRKWNKPVHAFLLRHVYASAITNYKISRTTAAFITYLLSAAVHELVMVVVTRKIRYVNVSCN